MMERRFFLYLFLALIFCISCTSIAFSQESSEIDSLKIIGRQYADAGNFDAAELAFNSILLIDPQNIPARNNLGVLYKLLGRYNDALRVLGEAEAIVKRDSVPDCPSLGYMYLNIGIIYNQKQDFELALQYLTFAENLFFQADIQSNQSSKVYNNIGNSYFGMNDFRKALISYKQGIEVKKDINASGLDISYANCASSYEKLGELDSASIYYNYSIEAKIARYGSGNFRLISTYNNYAVLLQTKGEKRLAYEYLVKALQLAIDTLPAKHPIVAECYERIGSWCLEAGESEKALDYYQKGINSIIFDFSATDVYTNPNLDSEIISSPALLKILIGKAIALENIYGDSGDSRDLLASLEVLELANMLTEKMRSSYLGEESKLLITEHARAGFDRSIRTAYNLYKLTNEHKYANKAFESAEKSKSSVLLASLQEVERKKNLAIPPELKILEQDLNSETDIYKKKLYEERQRPEPDQKKLGNWQARLFFLSQQLDSLDQVIKEKFPEYAAKYDNDVIDLNGIMNSLEPDRVLVEYSMSDTCLFIFTISNEDYFIERILIDSSFHADVTILSQFLRDNDFANNNYEDYQAYLDAAYSLYRIFLLPVEKQISGKKLLIIPDGELGYIPFEALLTEIPSGNTMEYRTLPYLIYKYRTNYSYSATLYFDDDSKRKVADRQLLAFAPTYDNMGEINIAKFPSNREFATYLVPLRFISTEINNISEILDCDLYEGYAATEKEFREQASNYDILHLAMHTLINDENPLYSQLVFTLNNDTLENNDGLLNAYEIFNMQLPARMAVLSACNTGYGKLQKGEGIMSMARGFIFAGVQSIIMTLWAVEDQSGSVLMSKFYQNLVEGMEIDEALREAKLQYLSEADQLSAHPYLWSGYVSIGSTDALIDKGFGKLYQVILAAVGLIVLIFLLFMFRKRRTGA
ncbi:MAG: hypothetical protein DRJ15_02655 [Bacteroidetes bacterium]|nr:MAG: hypothetical protein DRJ15_02655 [Bacteroidota bacterium]